MRWRFSLGPLRESGGNTPGGHDLGAWLEPYQPDPGAKSVRRTSHGLDGKAAPLHVGKGVTAEDHQIGVILIDPERDPCSLIWIPQLDPCHAVRVPIEIGEGMVERDRANRPRL